MARRKLRTKSHISFFAFQDIITSVSGILIIVTLILALNLGAVSPALEQEQATATQESQLAKLLDELTVLRRKAHSEAAIRGGQATSDEIAARAAQIMADAQTLSEQTAGNRSETADLNPDAEESVRAGALAKLSAGKGTRMAEIEKLKATAAARAAAAQAAAEAAEKAQDAALAELALKNVLRLIPEASATNREPVIVVLAESKWKLQRFDTKEQIDGMNENDFREAVKTLDKQKQYLVFYSKPSATNDFESYIDLARNSGFTVGYDLVPEEAEIELHSK